MPQACVYVLASLISGVSAAALILASSPSYTEARSLQGATYNVKWEQSTHSGRRASPSQVAYRMLLFAFLSFVAAEYVHDPSASKLCGGLLLMGSPTASSFSYQEHGVAWCMKSAQGTRLIPDGTISGARLFIVERNALGVGNLANINVPADGVASASGKGDGAHGLVFTRAYGQLEQIYDWTSFVSQERFCFRACKPSAAASTACPRIHDISGCLEDVPGNYDTGVFEDCIGDAIEVPSASYQEVLEAPSYYSALPPASCMAGGTIGNAQFARARRAIASMSDTARR
ncbi:hypothetical protein J3R83DRAFT_4954 [Lanmaoa asiatica]|nr:hypothetical protein J3R83DRAFT_4954 [Lanmaoa asiatica]